MFQGSHVEKEVLTPCPIKEGFFVSQCGEMSVSRDGLLYHYKSDKLYGDVIKDRSKYLYFSNKPIHVVVAETFLEIPKGFKRSELIVNHKDGIKSNNKLNNLEWATYSWNSKHAYLTGLREDNVRLKTKNIQTGEIREFNSIWDCARHFKVNGGRVHGYLNRKIREASFLGSHLLVKVDEEFPNIEEAKNWTVSDNRVSVIAFNKETKKAVIFQTVTHAADNFGLKPKTVTMALLRAKAKDRYYAEVEGIVFVPITHGKDYIEYVVEDRRKTEWVRTYPAPKRKKPKVKLTDLETGIMTEYEDIYKVCEFFGYCYGHFRANLVKVVNGEMFYKHFKIEYMT